MASSEREDELTPLISNEKRTGNDCKEFDDVIEIVGSQGKFQKMILYGILCPIVIFVPLFMLNMIFMLYIPDHWCHVPGKPDGMSIDVWKNRTIPTVVGPNGLLRPSQCLMLDNKKKNIKCMNGWDYDRTDFSETITSEYNWVCDKLDYSALALTVGCIGNAVGTIVFGQLADIYGRKIILFITFFVNVIPRIISLYFMEHIYLLLFFQFVIGTSFPAMFNLPSTIVAENCGKEYRGWVYAMGGMALVGGLVLLPLIAWLCQNWYYIGLATSVPGLLLFLYIPYLPESPRWLLSVGRIQDSAKVVRDIAKMNGTTKHLEDMDLEGILEKLLHLQNRGSTQSYGVWTLFTRARLAKNTIMLCTCWCVSTTVYLGIMMNVANLTGNQFLNFALLSIVELPSNWIGGLVVDHMGRRWSKVGFYFLSMLCFLIAGVAATIPSWSIVVIVGVIVGKATIAVTILNLNLQGTEIFPTQLRTTGTGFAATTRFIVSAAAPYVIILGQENSSLPHFAMALLTVVGMIAGSFLPETWQKTLPETIEDANNFAKDDKYWSFLPANIVRKNSLFSSI